MYTKGIFSLWTDRLRAPARRSWFSSSQGMAAHFPPGKRLFVSSGIHKGRVLPPSHIPQGHRPWSSTNQPASALQGRSGFSWSIQFYS